MRCPTSSLSTTRGWRHSMQSQSVMPLGEALVNRGLDFGDGYVRPAVVAFSADNDLQCMPDEVSPYVVFYNPKLVHLHQLARPGEAAPSAADGWSWAQFVRAARRAHRDGPSRRLHPAVVRPLRRVGQGRRRAVPRQRPGSDRTVLLAGEGSSAGGGTGAGPDPQSAALADPGAAGRTTLPTTCSPTASWRWSSGPATWFPDLRAVGHDLRRHAAAEDQLDTVTDPDERSVRVADHRCGRSRHRLRRVRSG